MRSRSRLATIGLGAAVVVCATCLTLLARNAVVERRMLAAQPGASAPAVVLPRVDRPHESLDITSLRGTPTVLYFCSIRCPVSNDYDSRVRALFNRYGVSKQVNFVAVHTGAAATSDRGALTALTASGSLPFMHVTDADGQAASQYSIALTPTFVLLDESGVIRYRGALDDNRIREQARATPLEDAIRSLLDDVPVAQNITVPHGCAIR
jgi:cytochrome oxidase Cu insertion factor (SCO1/SenC/PrrC family)